MDEIAKRYAPMMRQIAEIYRDNDALSAYILGLTVNRERWDSNNAGGHFYFDETPDDASTEIVDAVAKDSDGAPIEIILHLVGARGNWAEWWRSDGERILRWPPTSVTANPSFPPGGAR